MTLGLLLALFDAKMHLDSKITSITLLLLSIACLKVANSIGESAPQFSITVGGPDLLKPAGSFGILKQGGGHKMTSAGGRASYKMAGSAIRYRDSSTFQAEGLFNRMVLGSAQPSRRHTGP